MTTPLKNITPTSKGITSSPMVCPTDIGRSIRASYKLSGMHCTVRCCQLSARWEEFWESRGTD